MPSWVPKFKKKKSKRQLGDESEKHHIAPPVPAMPSPSPLLEPERPLRTSHSHNDLTRATPTDMWTSISQLESELVARYGRGAVPQFEALRERVQQAQQEQPRPRTETLPPTSRPARTFVSELVPQPPPQPVQTEEPEDDSDDGAAYLQALGIEAPDKPKVERKATYERPAYDTVRHSPPVRSTTAPPPEYPHDALMASMAHPSAEMLEQYASTRRLPRSDYVTTQLGPSVDTPRSLSPYSPTDSPDSPQTPGRRKRDLPPRPPPPNTFAPYAPTPPLHVPRSQSSLAVPSPHTPRSPQLSLPLVRVRITSPPNRGALRTLPALILLTPQAKATLAAATWAQMVTYCARNAGVSIARRGGGGNLVISIEERMAEVLSPGGGRGVGDEEVGFGMGYYVSVEMSLEEDGLTESANGESVPVARLEIPLPTTMGEVASVFRERKDIRKALS